MAEETNSLDHLTADLFDLDVQAAPGIGVAGADSTTDCMNTSTDCRNPGDRDTQ
ncbi:hypothetical protein [Amycolatopsis magusensis]|uniref:hypothetical protein n=1 Tax=Amycolatopsis magusensis TaxID=882444 RepID=UPI0037B46D15